MVAQIIRDFEDPKEVNTQLEQMGYNIGIRIVDEFCAKVRGPRCRNFRETMETVARDGFKMFLGVSALCVDWTPDSTACTVRLTENPLADYVELPPSLIGRLRYSSLLCGAIRGALEMVSIRVNTSFLGDALNGDYAPTATSTTAAAGPMTTGASITTGGGGTMWVGTSMTSGSASSSSTSSAAAVPLPRLPMPSGGTACDIRVQLKELLSEAAGKDYRDE